MKSYEFVYSVVKFISIFIPNKALRKKFRQNFTSARYDWYRKKYKIGEHSYVSLNTVIMNAKETTIGKFCTIGRDCMIGTSQHPLDRISIHSFTYCESDRYMWGDLTVPEDKIIKWENKMPPVNIGNDVWIGAKVIIKDGINIGDGAIVGSGAVVTKDVPPYAIVGGVPAKLIRYRFSEDIIQKLLNLKWWDYPKEVIVNLPFDNIEKCIEILEGVKD